MHGSGPVRPLSGINNYHQQQVSDSSKYHCSTIQQPGKGAQEKASQPMAPVEFVNGYKIIDSWRAPGNGLLEHISNYRDVGA